MFIRYDKRSAEAEIAAGGAAQKSPLEIAAEEAIATAKAAQAAAEARAAAAEAKVAAVAKPAEPKVETPAVQATIAPEDAEALKKHLVRERSRSRLDYLRQLGMKTLQADASPEERTLGEAQVLMLAPDADPSEPDGAAKFVQWKKDNAGLFRTPGQTQESVVESLKKDIPAQAKKSPLLDADKLLAGLFGGR